MKYISLACICFVILIQAKGQNVGIGTDIPTAGLDINTTLRVRPAAAAGKSLISDANGNATWGSVVRSEVLSFGSSAFHYYPNNADVIQNTGNGGIYFNTPPAVSFPQFYAPLMLPQGAKLNSITFYFIDNDALDITFNLLGEYVSGNGYGIFGSATSSGASSNTRSVTITPAGGYIIDNNTFGYSVRAFQNTGSGSFPSTLVIKAVTVNYTYNVN